MNNTKDIIFENILNYENNKITFLVVDDELRLKGNDVADILKYNDTGQALRKHVDTGDKLKFKALNDQPNFTNMVKNIHHKLCREKIKHDNESLIQTLMAQNKQLKKEKELIETEYLKIIKCLNE